MADLFRRAPWFLAVLVGTFLLGLAFFSLGSVGKDISDALQVPLGIVAAVFPVACAAQSEKQQFKRANPPNTPVPTRVSVKIGLCIAAFVLIGGSAGGIYWKYIYKQDIRLADQITVANNLNMAGGSVSVMQFPNPLDPRSMLLLKLQMRGTELSEKTGNCVGPGRLRIEKIGDGLSTVVTEDYVNLTPIRMNIDGVARLSLRVSYLSPTPSCTIDLSVADAVIYNPIP